MKFIYEGTELEFSVPASLPYRNRTKLVQVKDYSASGVTHVEDFEVQAGSFDVTFQEMPHADYVALLDWHVNIAVGMLNSFTFVDDLGEVYNVRFLSPELSGEMTGTGVDNKPLYNISFELELEN
jgi:hypothetical protein